jgi:hypothetical protein
VQFLFPPDRTVIHNFPAVPFHFQKPLSISVEKVLHPSHTFDGAMHQKVALPLKKNNSAVQKSFSSVMTVEKSSEEIPL